jgi:hypothetical protein
MSVNHRYGDVRASQFLCVSSMRVFVMWAWRAKIVDYCYVLIL